LTVAQAGSTIRWFNLSINIRYTKKVRDEDKKETVAEVGLYFACLGDAFAGSL
jgi:hypothetical protein